MLKKLLAIALVTNLGMRYLPEKYTFVNVGNPQTAETTNGEIDASANKKPTVSTLPEMSGIKDKITPTTPVSKMILEEAPMEPVSEPKESTNTITPQNDLPTAEIWFTFDQETNTITGYSDSTEAPKNVNIPSTINGVPVYNIGYSAFNGRQITGLTLPNGLKTIGSFAFFHGLNIAGNLVIPDSVTSIGYSAFDGCSSLTNLTIGNGVTSIWNGVFPNCSGLTNLTIGNSVTSIGESAFQDCDGLTSVTIPDSVTSIGKSAFEDCDGLTNLTIGNSVTEIGSSAFAYCNSLTSVTIPNSVTEIGSSAFYYCHSLTCVIIGNSVTEIGYNTFFDCSSLTGIVIPDSVTNIGESAFDGCSSLASVKIPDSVTSIGESAFYGCTSLTDAIISKNITSMASDVFGNTPVLQTIYMRGSRSDLPTSIISTQPWGALASTKVLYAGEYVTFDHTVKKVTGKYNRILNIRAFMNKPTLINRIMLPNGKIQYIEKSNWPDETGYYPYGSIPEEAITTNGTYVFKGYGDDNIEQSYAVEINDIGIITLRVNEASITEQMAPTASEQDILDLLNVSAEDEAGVLINGTDCTIWISPEDMNKIHTSHLGDVTTIRVNVKSSRSGQEMTSFQDVTLNTTSCVIQADNVDLWPLQCKTMTKQKLLDLMKPNVTVLEGTVDMTKLVISDEDFNKIKIGTPGIYNVLLTYDINKAKKRVQVTIMDDSPAALINIPSDIKMKNIPNDSVYGVGADETISIQPTAVSYYPQSFKIETNPSFWLESTATDATWINRMKVVVLDANDQPLSDNHLLATLSSSTIQSVPFKLRGYHNKWNSKGAYSGNMTFTITYGDSTP